MDPTRLLLDSALLPAALTLAVLGLAALTRRLGAGVAALAVALAVLGARAKIAGVPAFPATDALGWLFWLLPAFVVVGLLVSRMGPRAQLLLWILASALATRLLATAPVQHQWTQTQTLLAVILGGLSGGALIVTSTVEAARAPRRIVWSWSVLALLSALSLGMTGSVRLAQLGLALACSLACLGLLTLRRPAIGAAGAAPPLVLTLGALLFSGVMFSATPALTGLALALAPLALSLERRRPWLGVGVGLVLGGVGLSWAFACSGILDGPLPV